MKWTWKTFLLLISVIIVFFVFLYLFEPSATGKGGYLRNGKLSVSSNPSGATFFVDGIVKGMTPKQVSLSAGTHAVRLTKSGYQDHLTNVSIRSGKTTTLAVTLVLSQTGTLSVSSTPTGTTVYIDTVSKGLTPIVVDGLSIGTHQLRLVKSDYQEYTTTVSVSADSPTSVDVTLIPITPIVQTGNLDVSSIPSGASVYVDGVYTGVTPQIVDGLSPGSHAVRLVLAGYQEYAANVSIVAGQTTALTVTLTPIVLTGSLSVSSIPAGAALSVDGISRGVAPTVVDGLSPGSHAVLLTLANYQNYAATVSIVRDQMTTLSATLTPQSPGTSLYVNSQNPACTDTGPGSSAQPWCTIQKAASTASAGATVYIGDGTYSGKLSPVNSGTAQNRIRFIGAGQNVIMVNPVSGRSIEVSGKSYLEFSNIRLQGGQFYVYGSSYVSADRITATNGASVWAGNSNHVTFQNSEAVGNFLPHDGGAAPNTCMYFGDAVTASSMINNTVRGCDNGIQAVASPSSPSSDLTFEGNRYYQNPNHGLYIGRYVSNVIVKRNAAWQNQEGLYLAGVDTAEVSNNVFYYNGPLFLVDTVYNRGSRNVRVRNNLIITSDYFYVVDSSSLTGFSADYNQFYRRSTEPTYHWFMHSGTVYDTFAAYRQATSQDMHSIVGDPLVVNAAVHDFRLTSGSVAIDAGDPNYPVPPGGGSRIDIGGLEFQR
ncbi:MAG: PEGA domain-containing protein [Nanoarchaeota archaeon]